MKTTIAKCFVLMTILLVTISVNSQNLNIGNLTSIKADKGIIYVAGQSGIAALKPDLTVLW